MKEGEFRRGVFLTHRNALVNYATPLLGSREAAEDVVQDAFLKFAPEKIRARTAEQTLGYLFRVVRNLAFDVLKRRKIEAREKAANVPFWAIPRAVATPEERAVLGDDLRIVARVMARMPTETRIAIEMHRIGGSSLEEVADRLGISVATAHRLIKTAMVRIATEVASGSSEPSRPA